MTHHRFHVSLLFLCGLTVLFASIHPGQVRAQTPGNTIEINVDSIAEGEDYATRVLGAPWDMSTTPYPDFTTVFKGIVRSSFSQDGSGIWSFQTTNATPVDPSIQLLPFEIYEQGQPAAQFVMKFGVKNPIYTSQYSVLHLRVWASVQDALYVYWFPEPDWAQPRTSGPYTVKAGWNNLVIDLSANSDWTGVSKVVGLRIDPVAVNTNVSLKLDWVRLTPKATQTVPISWTEANLATPLYFYAGKTCAQSDALLLNILSNPTDEGTWNWGESWLSDTTHESQAFYPVPASLEPGTYQLFTLSNNEGTPNCTSLEIEADGILDFAKPSMRSGPEYSFETLGNAWDFSSSADVQSTVQITGISFDNGIFSGTSVAMPFMQADPVVNLNYSNSALINTIKYKYFTVRMKLDGNQDVGGGWVARVLWWHSAPTAATFGITQDIVLYEGWQEYTFDLSQAAMAQGPTWTGTKNQIRFDPHESWNPLKFYIDDIQLRGDEHIKPGQKFTVVYNATNAQTVTFYYDTDRDPGSGQVAMQEYVAPTPVAGITDLFLPLITLGGREIPAGNQYVWDTQNVNPGVYYVCAAVDNGVSTTRWCSETPVYIDG